MTGARTVTIGDERVVELVVHELGDGDGPLVVVLGGVHGDEPEGMLVARSLVADPPQLRATRLRVVTVANPSAYRAGTRTSAADGANLARCFPGARDGGWTERLADLLTREVLTGADTLIDLHSAGLHLAMPLLAGVLSEGALAERSTHVGRTLGLPYLWLHPELAPGRTLSAAADLGVAPVYVEMPGGPSPDRAAMRAVRAGLLRALGATSGEPVAAPVEVVSSGNLDDAEVRAPVDGLFLASVAHGDAVGVDDVLGEVLDPLRPELPAVPVRTPGAGHVMMLRRTAHVAAGTPLATVAPVVAR
ncbi:succinylglutamate desuccinylase/aspartoacylase family protein [Actinotalea caeni]|uniref:succinylglutamate desuccinylase/aspartoacylase family protein n=1 Tax=Actinotalea caeni TaxID=1348467 RepID=UPI0012E12DA2|nr:succinylglutamate desuccinylase/aspartoacylase family protein [Actinotalea caeni]